MKNKKELRKYILKATAFLSLYAGIFILAAVKAGIYVVG